MPTSQKLRIPLLLAALLIYLASVLRLRLPRDARGAAARLTKRQAKVAAKEPEPKVEKQAA